MKLNSLDKETAIQLEIANQGLCGQHEDFSVQIVKAEMNPDSTWFVQLTIKPNESPFCVFRELGDFCKEHHHNIYLARFE